MFTSVFHPFRILHVVRRDATDMADVETEKVIQVNKSQARNRHFGTWEKPRPSMFNVIFFTLWDHLATDVLLSIRCRQQPFRKNETEKAACCFLRPSGYEVGGSSRKKDLRTVQCQNETGDAVVHHSRWRQELNPGGRSKLICPPQYQLILEKSNMK